MQNFRENADGTLPRLRFTLIITDETDMLKKLSPYLLWAVLALPALTMISPFFATNAGALRGALHGSGEFAARFLIISLMATPLMMLTKGTRFMGFARWLRANRRYFGVAAFAYAALHVAAYVMGEGLDLSLIHI